MDPDLGSLYRRLQELEAKQARDAANVRRWYRQGFSSGLIAGVTALATVAMTGALLFGQAKPDSLYVDEQGRIGIGTTTPVANLDIQQAPRTAVHPSLVQGLYVTGDFAPASGIEFRHSNGTQGIGFGYNTIYATGANASQDLNINPRGGGSLRVNGQMTVSGSTYIAAPLTTQARYTRDDGGTTSYEISPRYHLSLTNGAYSGRTKLIPQEVIDQLCGDQDGCEVRLGMTRWGNGSETETASMNFLFYYSPADGHWRSSENIGALNGIDGANGVQHAGNLHNTCFFTDGTYTSYSSSSDPGRGMSLLVWNGFGGGSRTCELTLID